MLFRKFLLYSTACALLSTGVFSISGCKAADTVWSTRTLSPDNQWIASAETKRYGGFGSAGIQSTVTLQRQNGPDERLPVLQLSQDQINVQLTLRWLSPAQLDISYEGRASVDFQAVKCGGITITLHNTSLQ